jgi:hypothetical protein
VKRQPPVVTAVPSPCLRAVPYLYFDISSVLCLFKCVSNISSTTLTPSLRLSPKLYVRLILDSTSATEML